MLNFQILLSQCSIVHELVLIIIIKESLFKFWETGSGFFWNWALEDTEFQQNVWGWDVGVLGT